MPLVRNSYGKGWVRVMRAYRDGDASAAHAVGRS